MAVWLLAAMALDAAVLVAAIWRPPQIIFRCALAVASVANVGLILRAIVWGTVAVGNAFDEARGRRGAFRDAVAQWKGREPLGDESFLCLCDAPADDLGRNVALVARQVLAEYGGRVPRESVRPGDLLTEPLWHGVWWEDVLMRIEVDADVKLADWSLRPGEGARVRDLVAFVSAGVKPLARCTRA